MARGIFGIELTQAEAGRLVARAQRAGQKLSRPWAVVEGGFLMAQDCREMWAEFRGGDSDFQRAVRALQAAGFSSARAVGAH
jgi:hypothetical protein